MKRTILAVLLLVCSGFSVFGQNTDPIDVILLLNTSTGMSSSYENVNDYITGNFLSEFVRVGDTFHLIAFSGTPRLDVARRIAGRGDVETIIGRMMLQYPIESGNNVGEAISYAEQYALTLPARPKKIVLVSTGGSEVNDLVSTARQRLGSNTTIDFVEVTPGQRITNTPSSGRAGSASSTTGSGTSSTGTGSAAAGTGSTVVGTGSSGTQGTSTTTAQGTTTSASQTGTSTQSTQGSADSTASSSETGTSSASQTASGTESSSASSSSTTTTGTGTQQTGQQTTTSSRTTEARGSRNLSMPLIIGIILLLLLVLGLIIFFASRNAGSTPSRAMAGTSSSYGASSSYDSKEDERFPDHSKDLAKYAAAQSARRTTPYSDKPSRASTQPVVINPSGPLLLNIFVEDQNTAIGKRNIHSLKSGYSLTVGGGKSDFLIFLVKIPPAIGELRRNGSQLSFIPRKPKYFPDLGSSELRDCLNKTIRVVSDKGYELRFRFEMYEDPLVALNRVLMSIKVPG